MQYLVSIRLFIVIRVLIYVTCTLFLFVVSDKVLPFFTVFLHV